MRTIQISALALLLIAGTAGASDLRVQGQVITEAGSGTAPLKVDSATRVNQLNADRLDGFDIGDFAEKQSGVGVHYKNLVGLPGGEIDQDCAVNTGCFDGTDSAGFPVTISEPGSYRLAGNLDLSVFSSPEDVTAISIESSNVRLDLKGFAIRGTTTCTGTPVTSCSPEGLGRGISVDSGHTNVRIANGSVHGTGQYGVYCGSPCRVKGISVAENGQGGIRADAQGVVVDATARRNERYGIYLWAGGTVRGSIGAGNKDIGIIIASGSVVDSRATNNGRDGIQVTQSTVVDSSADGNGLDGIRLVDSRAHGNIATDNSEAGFACYDCSLIDNVAQNNGTVGISFNNTSNAWKGNRLFGNSSGAFSGSAVSLGNNACGSSLC